MGKPKFRTEKQVNDYYDERRFKIENRYYSRVRDIDNKMLENDEKLDRMQSGLDEQNAVLAQQRDRLFAEYERDTQSTLELEQQLEIERNRYQLLSEAWSQEEDPQRRQEIKDSAIETANKIDSLKSDIKNAEQQDFERKQRLWGDIQDVNRDIKKNEKKLDRQSELEAKQNQLVSKRDELSDGFDSDIQRNEQLRQRDIDNLPDVIPAKVIDVEGFGWTNYCDGGRIITVPIQFSIRLPEDMELKDVPKEVFAEMAMDAYEYVTVTEGGVVPGGYFDWTSKRPTGAGDYHFGDKGIAYNRTDPVEPEYDGYTKADGGYIKNK